MPLFQLSRGKARRPSRSRLIYPGRMVDAQLNHLVDATAAGGA
ncbi:hypothetical protein ACFUCV_03190 [Specibacter sp. NPDC057265]